MDKCKIITWTGPVKGRHPPPSARTTSMDSRRASWRDLTETWKGRYIGIIRGKRVGGKVHSMCKGPRVGGNMISRALFIPPSVALTICRLPRIVSKARFRVTKVEWQVGQDIVSWIAHMEKDESPRTNSALARARQTAPSPASALEFPESSASRASPALPWCPGHLRRRRRNGMGHRLLGGVRREREELQGVQLGGLRSKNQGWRATIATPIIVTVAVDTYECQ